jgi:hypothetical protein
MPPPRRPARSAAPTPTEAVGAAIAALDGTLAVARALVEGGRRIDLEGLEQEAAALCAAVMALGTEEARRMRPALEALRTHVDGLAATMRAA